MPGSPMNRYDPDLDWEALMAVALEEARRAEAMGEVPVGAALFTHRGELIASAANSPITLSDPTAHAEILCLRRAGEKLGNYRLTGTIMAVTLEPCLMCVGALIHARVAALAFGAHDPRTGAVESQLGGANLPFTNHAFQVKPGVLAGECSALLTEFFRSRRAKG